MGSPGIGRPIEFSIEYDHLVVGVISVAAGAETPKHTFFKGVRRQLVHGAIIQVVGCTRSTLIGGAEDVPLCIHGDTCKIRVCAVLLGITLEAVDDLLSPSFALAWGQLVNASEVKVATLIGRAIEVTGSIHGQTRFGVLS